MSSDNRLDDPVAKPKRRTFTVDYKLSILDAYDAADADERGAILSTLTRATIHLVAHTDPQRVRTCASPTCARLFVDQSRPRNRRWCSSTRCGNRARTKAYRRRQATTQ